MNPRNDFYVEPDPEDLLNPFSDPRTIPGGWDVSAFFAPEREYATRSAAALASSKRTPKSSKPNENS
jgi:hypothetical protein